jgi:hypothetical protein
MLGDIVNELKSHFETAKTDAEKFLTDHLPRLAALAEHAAANPVVDAILKAEHLTPSILQTLADLINGADAELAKLQAPPADTAADPDGQPAGAVPA